MTYFNRKKDLVSRALMALVVISIGLILMQFFSSCSEDDSPTEFLGKWVYENEAITPDGKIEFIIRSSESGYRIESITTGTSTWLDHEIREVSKEHIEWLSLTKNEDETNASEMEGLIFLDLNLSSDRNTIRVDSVIYVKELNYTYFKDQEIKKK